MRTDSEEFRDLDHADKWLARYTYESLDRWPSAEITRELLLRYPNKQPMILFRGMNFRTQDEFDTFFAGLQNGELVSHGISSWTHHRETARQFALVQKTYFPDRETFAQEKIARERGETLRGYRGVILKTSIAAHQGIDVQASKLGHEDEIILPAGTYRVEVEQIKPYGEQFANGERHVSAFIGRLKNLKFDDREDSEVWDHIIAARLNELTPTDRAYIFSLIKKDAAKTEVHLDDLREFSWLDKEKAMDFDVELSFSFKRRLFHYADIGVFGPEQMPAIQRIALKILRDFLAAAKAHPAAYLKAPHMGRIAKYAGRERDFTTFLRQRVGTVYNKLNSREVTSQVKTQKDIETFRKRMEHVMKQYAEMAE